FEMALPRLLKARERESGLYVTAKGDAAELPVHFRQVGSREGENDLFRCHGTTETRKEDRILQLRCDFKAGEDPGIVAIGRQNDQSVLIEGNIDRRMQMETHRNIVAPVGLQRTAIAAIETVCALNDAAIMRKHDKAFLIDVEKARIDVMSGN